MKAFEELQRERTQYHISEDRLPNVCFHSFEFDLVNDHFFSRLLFSYKEHSDIEESNAKSSLFFETFRKCQKPIFDELKCICDANDIFLDEKKLPDNSTITDVIIDEPSTPSSLQSIGIETIHANKGSLVMILKLTEEHSLTNLKDKCEDGSIGDVLIDLLQRKDVRERLIRGTYDFKMKLHATTEDAPYVEMKIEGTIFDKKERMCKHRTEKDSTAYSSTNLSREHPRHICEELEISDHLLDILHEKNLVPLDIARKLRVKVNRRDKIHELLRHYNACKEKGFSTLSKYIQMERELRGKKAYPLKLFEGKFRTKYDGSCSRIVHIGLFDSWALSSVAEQSTGRSETLQGAVHLVYCENDILSTRQFLKCFAMSGLQCHATEMTCIQKIYSNDSFVIVIPCSSHHDHWQEDDGLFNVPYPFEVAVIHDDESKNDAVVDWLSKNVRMPYKVHHVNLSDMYNQTSFDHFIYELNSSKGLDERHENIIIRHLKGSYEYDNKIYSEVVKQGLRCRIVSDISEEMRFEEPNTVKCVVLHQGFNSYNERLMSNSRKVWHILLIDNDKMAVKHVHTMMIGLRYKLHAINLQEFMWSQNPLQQLTDIPIRNKDGTACEVCICFDLPFVKYANIVYKGLESIGIRCIYAQELFPEMDCQRNSGVWLEIVQCKDIESDSEYVSKERLHVCVIDSASKKAIAPINDHSISIYPEDTKWPHKVKARLAAFQSFEGPGPQYLQMDDFWSRESRLHELTLYISSSEDEEKRTPGFQSSEKPKHQNSPSEKMFAQLRRRIKSKKHKETRSSSSRLTSRRVSDTSRSGISIKMADDESSSADAADGKLSTKRCPLM
ncbi:uncharacterized protein LOC128222624 [Mya arenaria]|uniref:uncharacterized protein LOC128222624 n=1 Tax=Mya arenaria TaxID=6604 RepID=UPI0022E1E5DD|nr:uncharacterized protein LOC128222624 [Mya arenaria]